MINRSSKKRYLAPPPAVQVSVDRDAFFYANHCFYKQLKKKDLISLKVGKETKLYLIVANNIVSEVISAREVLMPEVGANMLNGIENFRYFYSNENEFLYCLAAKLGRHGGFFKRMVSRRINWKTYKS